MGCNHPMGFFLHIPFPAREVLTTLPTHDVLIRALFSYDVVGFQTEGDRDRFLDYVVHEAQGRILGPDRVQAFGREIVVSAFPIGIDAKAFARYATTKEAQEHAARMRRVLANRLAILGVDRLDYSKGLPERFRAFERLLSSYPENRGRVSYIQIAPRSRADVQDYIDIRREPRVDFGKHQLRVLRVRLDARCATSTAASPAVPSPGCSVSRGLDSSPRCATE